MKIIIHLSICLICLGQTIQSQDLIRYSRGGLFGYADTDGNVIIDVQYDEATEFGVNLNPTTYAYGLHKQIARPIARVKRNGLWSVINKKGEPILPPSKTRDFTVKEIGTCGSSWALSDSLTVAKVKNTTDGSWRLFDLENEMIGKYIYQDEVYDSLSFRSGFRRRNLDCYIVASRKDSIANKNTAVKKEVAENRDLFLYDYYILNDFVGEGHVCDLINTFDGTLELEGMKSIVKICPNNYYGQNSDGNGYLYNCETKETEIIEYPLHSVHKESSQSNSYGSYRGILDPGSKDCSINYYVVGNSGRLGLLDKNRNIFLDTLYSNISIHPNYFITVESDTPIDRRYANSGATNNRKVSLLGYSGNPIDIPELVSLQYVSGDYFIGQLKSKKFVLLDRRGQLVGDEQYDRLSSDLRYKQGDISGIINLKGDIIFSYPCDELSYFNPQLDFDEKYYLIKKDRKVGLVKEDRTIVFPIKYKHISLLDGEEKLLRLIDENGLSSVVDFDQNVLIPFKYDYLRIEDISITGSDVKEKHIICFMDKEEVIRYDLEMNVVKEPIWKGKRKDNFDITGMKILKGTPNATAVVDAEDNVISDTVYYDTRQYKLGDDYIVTGLLARDEAVDVYNSKGKRIAKEVVLSAASYVNGKIKNVRYLKELNAIIITKDSSQALVNLDGDYLLPLGKYEYINYSSNWITATRMESGIPYTTMYDAKLNQIAEEYAHFTFLTGQLHRKRSNYIIVAKKSGSENGKDIFKYGVINLNGRVTLPFEYHEMRLALGGLSLTQVSNGGTRWSKYYDMSLVFKHEGLYDYYIGQYPNNQNIQAMHGDNIVTINKEGVEDAKPLEYSVAGTSMLIRKKGNQSQLCDSKGGVIYATDFSNGMLQVQSVVKLLDDRYIFQLPNKLFLLSKKGKVLAELDCDLWHSQFSRFLSSDLYYFDSYTNELLPNKEHLELLEKKLLKIELESEIYYYNFEKLISFKE